jgi:hypothetical protein
MMGQVREGLKNSILKAEKAFNTGLHGDESMESTKRWMVLRPGGRPFGTEATNSCRSSRSLMSNLSYPLNPDSCQALRGMLIYNVALMHDIHMHRHPARIDSPLMDITKDGQQLRVSVITSTSEIPWVLPYLRSSAISELPCIRLFHVKKHSQSSFHPATRRRAGRCTGGGAKRSTSWLLDHLTLSTSHICLTTSFTHPKTKVLSSPSHQLVIALTR